MTDKKALTATLIGLMLLIFTTVLLLRYPAIGYCYEDTALQHRVAEQFSTDGFGWPQSYDDSAIPAREERLAQLRTWAASIKNTCLRLAYIDWINYEQGKIDERRKELRIILPPLPEPR